MTATAAAPAAKDSESQLIASFKAARRVSTPIVSIDTPDAAATIEALRVALNGKTIIFLWDCVRGLHATDKPSRKALEDVFKLEDAISQPATVNAAEMLLFAARFAPGTVLILYNFHRQLEVVENMQALWNLRDIFKMDKRMVVLLGPSFKLPQELGGDIISLDEPLPTRGELDVILCTQYKNAVDNYPSMPALTEAIREAALDAVIGLPAYTAEAVISMSITKNGLDLSKLWNRKVKAIENTDGLRVWKGTDSALANLKGIDNVVEFFQRLIDAQAFGAIVFIDEGDKAFAGGMSDATGDSGVSKDQVGQILTYIEDNKSLGVLLAGVAGTGKTELAKAVAASSGKPLIIFDMGGMKGGIMGQSERAIRAALKVVTATAEGKVLFIMTANKTTLFTPELNRRFPDQFFFDVPSAEGRAAIWPVHIAKNKLLPAQAKITPGFDAGWTGAEIKRACDRAALFGCPVMEAARYIIPACISGKSAIAALRKEATDRFLSASEPGNYRMPEPEVTTAPSRQIELEA